MEDTFLIAVHMQFVNRIKLLQLNASNWQSHCFLALLSAILILQTRKRQELCINYHPIFLISINYKIFSQALDHKLNHA